MTQRRKRTPNGVLSTKPIALRLMPEERIEAERLANATGKTKSNLAREAYLTGLSVLYPSKNSVASSSSAESPGGTVATSPDRAASFLTATPQR